MRYQGATIARNRIHPCGRRRNLRQTTRTDGLSQAVPDIATIGISSACTPLASVPRAINIQAAISQRSTLAVSPFLTFAAPSNDQNDRATKHARKGSGITRCVKKKVPLNIASVNAAANAAERVPITRCASKPVAKNQPAVARATGKRAPNSLTPNTRIERISHQYTKGGFWSLGTPSWVGVNQSPRTIISRAAPAYWPSIWSNNLGTPQVARYTTNNAAKAKIQETGTLSRATASEGSSLCPARRPALVGRSIALSNPSSPKAGPGTAVASSDEELSIVHVTALQRVAKVLNIRNRRSTML